MKRVKFEVVHGTFSSWDTLFQQVVDFASEIGPEDLINISHSADGRTTIWYWADENANTASINETSSEKV